MTQEIDIKTVSPTIDNLTPEQRKLSTDMLDAQTQVQVEQSKELPF